MAHTRTPEQYNHIISTLYPDPYMLTEVRDKNGNVITTNAAVLLMRTCPELTLTESTVLIRQWISEQPQVLNE